MRGLAAPLVKGAIFLFVTLVATATLGVTIANVGMGDKVAYTARFTDATSLNPGDDVRMAGVRIGEVEAVEVADRRFAEVTFAVDAHRAVSRHATAAIRYRNMVGQRYLSLDQGPLPMDRVLAPGAHIPLERTRPAVDLTAMFNGFKPLFQALSPEDVNKLSFEIVQVLQGEGGTVDSLLRHTASLTSTLAERDRVIGEVIANLNAVLDTINAKGDQLATLVTTTQRLVQGLAADAEPIGDAVGGMGELTSSTAALLEEGRKPLKDGIVTLGELSRNLADNTPIFERFLGNLPTKYDRIGRTASYGSWLNFYLCSVSSDAEPAPGGPPVGRPVEQARCLR
ncbi:phospholipid/cholesterol/gamma-HCH transport system substrate-binding protein [Saccharopolyspora erythraea NRRL 2338]|uniref:Possible Mce family protein n=2 Tax=Saccharopolyspora erythraea TaxID=1836 RepID=A4FC84_SACEN|nr:MCE family protein [Saccharopolyspora erythraea]PFG95421.1 phospholipid/cholesterol/gamma-HCH transport system substrate-binding protein [Saccharopolyspora erythraea NRRL 2338]QRK92059.1 MCE family protein [Saccharopolyspora erythraea]CAM01659.1 possible Mce family protein [Saccharopolyspora erythraea NRRL 2338]